MHFEIIDFFVATTAFAVKIAFTSKNKPTTGRKLFRVFLKLTNVYTLNAIKNNRPGILRSYALLLSFNIVMSHYVNRMLLPKIY